MHQHCAVDAGAPRINAPPTGGRPSLAMAATHPALTIIPHHVKQCLMPNKITELCSQYDTLLKRLDEAENEGSELNTRLEQCGRLCLAALREFRTSITADGFPDSDTEIHFFKKIKPAIAGRQIYYKWVHRLHLGELKGCWLKEKERLTFELDVITKIFKKEADFLQYIRGGGTALDSIYFLREHYDWGLSPLSTDVDEHFNTCKDGQLAELIALEMQMQYLTQLLRAGEEKATALKKEAGEEPLKWTGTQSEFTELIYFLFAAVILNHGKATLIGIKKALERAFQFEVPEFYHLGGQLFERKEQLRFTKRATLLLLRYLESRIN